MPVTTRSKTSKIRSSEPAFNNDGSTRPSRMQTLIPDVLVQIFRYCVQIDSLMSLPELKAPTFSVTTLAVVCKHWRDVVLDNPLLWGCITMLGISKQDIAMLDLCLERSQCVPILFNMYIKGNDKQLHLRDAVASGRLSRFERVFSSLVSQQRRWKSFGMLCSHPMELPTCKWFLNDMPLLENFILRTPIDHAFGAPSFCIDLSRSSRLRFLGLFGDIQIYPVPSLSLENLTSMNLDHIHTLQHFPSVSDCLTLLSLAPNLKQLVVFPSSPSLPSPSALPHVVLPKLSFLNVGAHGERTVIAKLLAQLTLPALRDLRIVNDVIGLPWQGEVARSAVPYGIPELLTRSRGPPLTNFTLDSVVEQEPYLFAALAHMPHLRTLNIASCCTISCFTFEALTLRHATSNKPAKLLCPALERISFAECTLTQINETPSVHTINKAAEMIASRWSCAPLQRKLRVFKAMYAELSDLNNNPLIVQCVSEGLDFQCTDDGPDGSRKNKRVKVIRNRA